MNKNILMLCLALSYLMVADANQQVHQSNQERMKKLRNIGKDRRDHSKKQTKSCQEARKKIAEIKSIGRCGWVDYDTGKVYEHLGDQKRTSLLNKYKKQVVRYCQ